MSKRLRMIMGYWLTPNRLVFAGFTMYLLGVAWIVIKLYRHFKFRFLGHFCELIGLADRREAVFAGGLAILLILLLLLATSIDVKHDNEYFTKEK